jgi:hypothetical protein
VHETLACCPAADCKFCRLGAAVSAGDSFDSVPHFLKLPPNLYIGEPAGVATNSKGHVFVFSRGGSSMGPAFAETAAQLLEFGPDGKFLREIGKNLYAWSFAHAVRIDKEGEVLLVSGRKQEAANEDTGPLKHPNPPLPAQDGRYRQPTDVTWDRPAIATSAMAILTRALPNSTPTAIG